MRTVVIASASASAPVPESAAHDVAASAARAFCTDCASDAENVLAAVVMLTPPTAFEVATAVELDAPEDEVDVPVLPVPLPAAAALEALPELKEVATMRADSASAVALDWEGPPDCEVEEVVVVEEVTFCGAEGLMDVSWVL